MADIVEFNESTKEQWRRVRTILEDQSQWHSISDRPELAKNAGLSIIKDAQYTVLGSDESDQMIRDMLIQLSCARVMPYSLSTTVPLEDGKRAFIISEEQLKKMRSLVKIQNAFRDSGGMSL